MDAYFYVSSRWFLSVSVPYKKLLVAGGKIWNFDFTNRIFGPFFLVHFSPVPVFCALGFSRKKIAGV